MRRVLASRDETASIRYLCSEFPKERWQAIQMPEHCQQIPRDIKAERVSLTKAGLLVTCMRYDPDSNS